MNKRGLTISLVALMSLVIGILLLTGLVQFGVRFAGLGEVRADNSDLLPEIISLVLSPKINDSVTRSFELSEQDLFLFFNQGDEDILLEFTREEDYRDFIFKRPDECMDATCICHCNDGAYWENTDEEPYLIANRLLAGQEFSCTTMTCQSLPGAFTFHNSQGSQGYFSQRETQNFYNPVSMDILTLLHFMDRQIETPIQVLREAYVRRNPFYGTSFWRYTKDEQSKSYFDALNYYRWRNGYVLGGFGIEDDADEDDREDLSVLPIVLKVEAYENRVLGICLQETCLLERDEKELQREILLTDIQRKIDVAYDFFINKLDTAPACYDGLAPTQDDVACTPLFSLLGIYLVDNQSLVAPQVIFEIGNTQQQFSRVTFGTSRKSYDEITTPLFFGCEDENGGVRIPNRLHLLDYIDGSRFETAEGETCDLNILPEFPDDQLLEIDVLP